ncbi:MAG TPA: glycine betaine ABC transporter substrate-binding protein [Nitriliruptorales bacterium]|nr:glycine betaine ABC transporter substrate-binding protein [Nitriliruptorales bacterium]
MHSRTSTRVTGWLAVLVALTTIAAACGGGDQPRGELAEEAATVSPSEDLLSERYDLSGVTVRFGSKDFTEQLVLGQIASKALEAAGASVRLVEDLPSPAGTRDALLAGEIDAAWEYTGTAWVNYLGHTEPIEDPMEQFEAVKEQDLERNDVFWTQPAPFNDTYGFAYRGEAEEEFGIETVADLVAFVEENPDQATLCVDNNFASRDDGLPRVEKVHDFTWPRDKLTVVDHSILYPSAAEGDPCNFTEVFTTDGRIAALDLKVLEDREGAFISYLSSVMMMSDFAQEHPQLADLFEEIGAPITEELMIELNRRVDVDGEFPEDVAEQYLRDLGFID